MALFSSFSKIVSGLTKTRSGLMDRLGGVLRPGRTVDESAYEDLEDALITSDLGAALASVVMEGVRQRARRARPADASELGALVRDELRALLPEVQDAANEGSGGAGGSAHEGGRPRVVVVVGVNGGGKTTTVGKLAARAGQDGRSVVIAAADTFRAAAIEQLEVWAGRAGAEIVRHKAGADPSAVVFDAAKNAAGRGADLLIVDTAGRLHTRANLMQELEKIVRIVGREIPGAPDEVLLVLDATTGQNGLAQAREFLRAAHVTGVVLTKLDGTARGGIALAIAKELELPLRYVGVGEAIDDLVDFDPDAYVTGLLGEPTPAGESS